MNHSTLPSEILLNSPTSNSKATLSTFCYGLMYVWFSPTVIRSKLIFRGMTWFLSPVSFNKSILIYALRVSCLVLSDNNLGDELSLKGDYVFDYFKDLTSLDLSLNGIKRLPFSTFKNQTQLRYLNLSRNSLLLMNFQISHMSSIQTIDISDNLLSQFNKKLQDDMDSPETQLTKFHIKHARKSSAMFLWNSFIPLVDVS